MLKHFSCYIFFTLFSISVCAADKPINTQVIQPKTPKIIIDIPSGTQPSNNEATNKIHSETPKQLIQDPNHPMIYCREHTC